MDVILLERVEKLGAIGDVVTVKNGFARNYLLPNKKALRANESNRKLFEAKRSEIETDNANKRTEAEAASKGIEGKTVKLIRQASNTGQLYGSVSARDIVDALDTEGAKVTKSQVVLDRPIKAIGLHEVRIALHPEVSVAIKVNVARSPEEAELQAQGVDIMASMFERDNAGFTEEFDPNAEPGVLAVEAEVEVVEVEVEEAAPVEAPAETAEAEVAVSDDAAGVEAAADEDEADKA
ncbi:MAG TPA: 50S ribosomal protein L9 [Sphingomicrobium sp.]|nr:50S ribosomal protein L9 [Sphingomicrobium sp.]